MNWLTDNPFPVILLGLLVIGACFTFGWITRQRGLILAGVVSVLVTLGLVVVEQLIVTDRETIVADVHEMARAVRRNDLPGLLSHVAENAVDGQQASARIRLSDVMSKVTFHGCQLMNLQVEVPPDGTRATCSFLAVVNVETDFYGGPNGHRGPGRQLVHLTFEKNDLGEWKVVFFDHQDPFSTIRL